MLIEIFAGVLKYEGVWKSGLECRAKEIVEDSLF